MPDITYREATLDDAELAADLMTAAYPPFAQDPVLTRFRWEKPRRGFGYGRFIAERDGRAIAFLDWVHGPWADVPDRHCEIEVWLERQSQEVDILVAMLRWIEERALPEGPRLFMSYCGEDEAKLLHALDTLGYEKVRIEKVSELDLKVHGPSLVDQARRAREMAAAIDIRCTTLAEWDDPEKVKKLHDMERRTVEDIPHTLAMVPESFEDFSRKLTGPDRPLDRFWIALHGDLPVSMSHLKFPPVRGTVWTSYTCTDPAYRGRGLAKAIKLQTLAQAFELGVPVVCTTNDAENVPILRINRELGYTPRAGFVEHHKRVERRDDA